MKNFFSDKELFSFDNDNIKYYNNGKYILSKILINVDINFANLMEINSNVIKDDISLNSLKNELNNTIFPCYLLKNRYNNNFFIANLFYKINTSQNVYKKNIDYIHNIENPYSLKCVDNFEDDYFYYVVYEYYDETLEDFIKVYRKNHDTMPVNFIHKILTQLNVCFKKMVKFKRFHKDIKPGNIFIIYINDEKDNFDIRLGGFILSVDEEGSNHSSCSVGNDNFKAPESYNEGKHDKCDLWSVGVLIYYLYFLKPLKDPFNFKKPADKDLRDLIEKLIVYNPLKRMNWEEYFSHPFFKKYN
jgi:serine/threonine protein kinase